jgi:heptosyltransferase-2
LKPASVDSILLLRLSSLGDILLLTPALRGLRAAQPQARIDLLTSARFAELLQGNPHLTNLILCPDHPDPSALQKLVADLRGRYDVVVDLHTNLRSFYLRRRLQARKILKYKKRRLARWLLVRLKWNLYHGDFSIPQAYLRALQPWGAQDDGRGLEWPAAKAKLPEFMRLAGLARIPAPRPIALCPGASHFTKRWPETRWRELVRRLLEIEPTLWVFGDKEDSLIGELLFKTHPERIVNFCGRLTLAPAGAGLSLCRIAITHDAGPAHMAAAVGIPVLAIFGSTVPQFGFRPFRVPHRIAEIDLFCRPCSHLGFASCPLGHFRCMKDLAVNRIMSLFAELSGAQAQQLP